MGSDQCAGCGKKNTAHAALGTCCSGLEFHSLPLLGLAGCFICVSGSWFRRKSFARDSPILLTLCPSDRSHSFPHPPPPPLPREINLHTYIHMLPVRSTEPATNRVTELKNIYGIQHFALKSNFIFYTSSKIRHKTCPHTRTHTHTLCQLPHLPPGLYQSREFSWARRTYSCPCQLKSRRRKFGFAFYLHLAPQMSFSFPRFPSRGGEMEAARCLLFQ